MQNPGRPWEICSVDMGFYAGTRGTRALDAHVQCSPDLLEFLLEFSVAFVPVCTRPLPSNAHGSEYFIAIAMARQC